MIDIRACNRRTNMEAGKTNDEIDERSKGVHLDQTAIAIGHFDGSPQKIGAGNDIDQGSILKQDDGLRQQDGQHVSNRLRQHNVGHDLPVIETESHSQQPSAPWKLIEYRHA